MRMPVLVVHSHGRDGRQLGEEGGVGEVEPAVVHVEVPGDGLLHPGHDAPVQPEVGLGEDAGVGRVDVDELFALGEGAGMEVEDGGASRATASKKKQAKNG